ncbi:MAG: helix-turn-helix domain-containing protein [Candidatus Helarchaeota archaeon]
MEKLLTPQEIADILGVQPSTIYQWTHQGYIPHVKIGKFVRFKEKDVEKWVERKEESGRMTKKLAVEDML